MRPQFRRDLSARDILTSDRPSSDGGQRASWPVLGRYVACAPPPLRPRPGLLDLPPTNLYGWFAARVRRFTLIAGVTLFFAANLVVFWTLGLRGVRLAIPFFLTSDRPSSDGGQRASWPVLGRYVACAPPPLRPRPGLLDLPPTSDRPSSDGGQRASWPVLGRYVACAPPPLRPRPGLLDLPPPSVAKGGRGRVRRRCRRARGRKAGGGVA